MRTPALLLACASLLALTALPGAASAQSNGATLSASKTIDICRASDGLNWTYSGVVSVWNSGIAPTQGLKIVDSIENKISGPTWTTDYTSILTDNGVVTIPGFTPPEAAITFPYSILGAPLPGTIRNNAQLTITNHSGHITVPPTPFGPNPKATYTGPSTPPLCSGSTQGCTYTQGYWKAKPGVIWPAPYARTNLFYLSGQTWQVVLNTPVSASQGYYQLAHQYIAAKLNEASGATVPSGIQTVLGLATPWLTANAPSACTTPSACGLQKTWAATLDTYNNGVYPGGPPHCGDE
jgi:hypothetical protein